MEPKTWALIVGLAVGLGYPLLEAIWKAMKEAAKTPEPGPQKKAPAPSPSALPKPPPPRATKPAPAPPPARAQVRPTLPSGPSAAQKQLAANIDQVLIALRDLDEPIRQEVPLRRFVPLLTDWLPRRLTALKEEALKGSALLRPHVAEANWLFLVWNEAQELIRQRRVPDLLAQLGDADALADRCYAPVIEFARAEGLPLASAQPVTQLSGFDLSIWTGFAPTSLAPLFLPSGFFTNVFWWPAIAHEIGHDFLVSVEGLRDRLGAELGLPTEAAGTIPLRLVGSQLEASELWRLYGGWLEELFCDVFGTLMCGPAYAHAMVELFSYEEDPREVLVVGVDRRSGRYDPHPPRHLRVDAACRVLERAGFDKDAQAIRGRWFQRNSLDPSQDVPLLFWAGASYISLPFSAFSPLTQSLVERLYEGPLSALNGFGLQDISGLDFGPHEHQDALRAKASLLSGSVPRIRDARAIISGAVLAAVEAPEKQAELLLLARRAIPAVGTNERRPDAFDLPVAQATPTSVRVGSLDLSARALGEAMALQGIFDRPGPGRHAPPTARRASALRRR